MLIGYIFNHMIGKEGTSTIGRWETREHNVLGVSTSTRTSLPYFPLVSIYELLVFGCRFVISILLVSRPRQCDVNKPLNLFFLIEKWIYLKSSVLMNLTYIAIVLLDHKKAKFLDHPSNFSSAFQSGLESQDHVHLGIGCFLEYVILEFNTLTATCYVANDGLCRRESEGI